MWRWESGGLVFSSKRLLVRGVRGAGREREGGTRGSRGGARSEVGFPQISSAAGGTPSPRKRERERERGPGPRDASRPLSPLRALSAPPRRSTQTNKHNTNTRRTCMPAMATGLRVALEATLRDWVGLATRAFLEDMIMEFMVSVFEFWYWCVSVDRCLL